MTCGECLRGAGDDTSCPPGDVARARDRADRDGRRAPAHRPGAARPRRCTCAASVPTPAAPGALDAVLISHLHHDHLDKPSLRGLRARRGRAPSAPRSYLPPSYERARGARRRDADDRRRDRRGRPRLARRPPPPRARAEELDTLGYLVDGIWFAGDTDYDPAMEALRGRVDVALIPIWGWGPSLGPGHLDPDGAARAIDADRSRGSRSRSTGARSSRSGSAAAHARLLTDPPLRVRRRAGRARRPREVETVAPGGSLACRRRGRARRASRGRCGGRRRRRPPAPPATRSRRGASTNGCACAAAEPAVRADELLERRDLVEVRPVGLLTMMSGQCGKRVGAAHVLGGVRAERRERVLALDRAGRQVAAVAPSTSPRRSTSTKPIPGCVAQRVDQAGPRAPRSARSVTRPGHRAGT